MVSYRVQKMAYPSAFLFLLIFSQKFNNVDMKIQLHKFNLTSDHLNLISNNMKHFIHTTITKYSKEEHDFILVFMKAVPPEHKECIMNAIVSTSSVAYITDASVKNKNNAIVVSRRI